MDDTKLKFKRKAIKLGNSVAITLPEEITAHQNIIAGDTLILQVDENKHKQRFIAVWKDATDSVTTEPSHTEDDDSRKTENVAEHNNNTESE